MSPVEKPKGSWFEQAEQAVDQLEKAHMEGATLEPAGIALAFLRGSLAIAEALGGVCNELAVLREIDGQLNGGFGEMHEQLRQALRVAEQIERAVSS